MHQEAAPFNALSIRSVISPVCWAEVGEAQLTDADLIQEMTEKIIHRTKIQAARDTAKNTVMSSDSASSEVTYTSISSHGDPLAWAVDFFRLYEPDSSETTPAPPDYSLEETLQRRGAERERKEEHLALADSVVTPVADHVPSFEETELFETDESAATLPSPPACHTTARISIRPEEPVLLPHEEGV
ncbi:hypothetical protein Tco_0174893 [Tanacetum coccineum]